MDCREPVAMDGIRTHPLNDFLKKSLFDILANIGKSYIVNFA